MKKKVLTAVMAASVSLALYIPAYAQGWMHYDAGWWYGTNADNTAWYSNGWQWIDGNGDNIAECYYFGPDGYMLADTVTPDGYTVDGNGAWVENGVVQTKVIPINGVYRTNGDSDDPDDYGHTERYVRQYENTYEDEDVYEYEDMYEYVEQYSSDRYTSSRQEADPEEYAYQVYELVNEERDKEGLQPLEWDEGLAECAAARAEEIVEKFSHTRPDGSSYSTILDEYGLDSSGVGENIAYGYTDPENVMDGWMHSSGHKANILRKNYDRIGVGCHIEDGSCYWVQLFKID